MIQRLKDRLRPATPAEQTIPCITELGDELMRLSGVIELSKPDEYDFTGLYEAIRRNQEVGTFDYLETVLGYLGDDAESLELLNHLVGLGAKAVEGSNVFVDAKSYSDLSHEGEPLGSKLHIDREHFTMIITEKLGTLVMVDPDNPGRLLSDTWSSIENPLQYLYSLRPNVLTMMHSHLWHIRPQPDDLRRLDPDAERRLLNMQYANGIWPSVISTDV